MIIVEAANSPIILNEYTSKKEYLENKKKIDNLRRESRDIDSEEKLNAFLKKNLKNIEEINKKVDQKKYINNSDKLFISAGVSAAGLIVADILSDNHPIGAVVSIAVSILSLVAGLVHKLVQFVLNNNDNKDRENMKDFCDKLRNNLSKNIKDPTEIQDPKLRSTYLKLMHELDVSSSKLFAISYSKEPYTANYYNNRVTSSDEIKYRTNLLKDLFSKLSSYIDFSDININKDSDIRNFVSGYNDATSLKVYIKESIYDKNLKSTFKSIENTLKNMTTDEVTYELKVPEDTIMALDYILDAEKRDNIDDVTDEDFESARFVIINVELNK